MLLASLLPFLSCYAAGYSQPCQAVFGQMKLVDVLLDGKRLTYSHLKYCMLPKSLYFIKINLFGFCVP
jgi:hypothetical protein